MVKFTNINRIMSRLNYAYHSSAAITTRLHERIHNFIILSYVCKANIYTEITILIVSVFICFHFFDINYPTSNILCERN